MADANELRSWNEIREQIISEDPEVRLNGIIEARKCLSDDNPQIDDAVHVGIVQIVANYIEDLTKFVIIITCCSLSSHPVTICRLFIPTATSRSDRRAFGFSSMLHLAQVNTSER